MGLRSILVMGLPLTLVAAAPFGYSLTMPSPPAKKAVAAAKPVDKRKVAEKLCASRSVNDRLKARIFAEAAVAGEGPSSNLDLLSSFSEVRMDQPLLKDQDEELGITVCTGRFVLLLPPGSEERFGGRTLLQADVEYAAQPAADGSGLVYQLRGADSIVYRLAAYNLRPDEALRQRAAELAAARAVISAMPPLPEAMVPTTILPITAAPVVADGVPAVVEKQAPEPATPVRLATVGEEREKPQPVEAKRETAKLAKTEPKSEPKKAAKPAEKEVRLAAKAEGKQPKATKSEPVRSAEARKPAAKKPGKTQVASAEPKTKPKSKPVESAKPKERLAATAKKKPVTPEKPKQELVSVQKKPVSPDKPKQQLATSRKSASEKPKQQLAVTKKPAAPERPTQLAAAAKKAPKPQPAAGGTTNTFLTYEQRKASALQPVSEPAPGPRPAPVRVTAAADRCATGGAAARLVCANPNLRAKQRSVDSSYYAALEDADGEARRRLTSSRSRFAAYVDRCSTATCLANAYDDRLAEIRDIMAYY